MMRLHFIEPVAPPFDFVTTAQAHGWVMLRPFSWEQTTEELGRVQRLTTGQVVSLRLKAAAEISEPAVSVTVESETTLTPAEQNELRLGVRRMLRLDENFSEFYQLMAHHAGWPLRLKPGGGRLLRCPTLFEDIIYTLCTTNINWAGTIRMVERLVLTLGESFPGRPEWRAFPTSAAIVAAGPDVLRRETGLGYRSDYVWQLAAQISEGHLDLAAFEDPTKPSEVLLRELRQLKGVGNYAAATILMLLGRYEHLAIDSELRAFATKKYFQDEPPTEAQIREIYAPWGRWQYLAYWFDTPL